MPSLEGTAPLARVGHTGTAVGATKVYYYGGYGIRCADRDHAHDDAWGLGSTLIAAN